MNALNKPCTVLNIFSFLSKRWTLLIIKGLSEGATTFSDILRYLPGISSRILTERFRELEAEGFVKREVISESPIKIRYGLTEKGRSFEGCLGALAEWQKEWDGK